MSIQKNHLKPFLLPWEQQERPKEVFATNKLMPFTMKERRKIGDLMSIEQILNTNSFEENESIRLLRKWKEIIHLWSMTRLPEYKHGSLENSLWLYGTTGITVHHFCMAVLNEFGFKDELHMDAHLRWLYWSFDGGAQNETDWREVLAACKIPLFFRMVRERPVDLLVMIFDIFAEGGTTSNCMPNDTWFINDFDELRKGVSNV